MIGSSCISTIVSERVTFVIKEESIHCVDKILQLLSIIIVVYWLSIACFSRIPSVHDNVFTFIVELNEFWNQ